MKFVIAGAGAVGAYMGAAMARAGLDVTLFARGPQLRAIEERGVRVISRDGDFEARPRATGDLESIGPADVVFWAGKAHSLPQLAPRLGCLLGPETCVVSLQNGVPWWFTPLERVDPGGAGEGRGWPGAPRAGRCSLFGRESAQPAAVGAAPGVPAGSRDVRGQPAERRAVVVHAAGARGSGRRDRCGHRGAPRGGIASLLRH